MRIHAPIGSFESLKEAAAAESSIDWQQAYGADHRACVLSFAAEEIADHLNLVRGLHADCIPIAPRTNRPGIYLVTLEELSRLDTAGLMDDVQIELPDREQGFTLICRNREEAHGDPEAATVLIVGFDGAGALYGAYAFLGRIGFHWFSPDPWDQIAPSRVVIDECTISGAPSFLLRGFWATDARGSREFLLWMARNRLNLWSAVQPEKPFCRKLGIKFTTGGHTIFARYADPGTHFDEHPSWYGLHDGERRGDIRGNVGDNICFANDEARRHIAESLADDLATGEWRWVDLINVWALDNGRYCECEACRGIGNPTDQIMLLAHDCRQAINRAREAGRINREVLVSIPAYHETLPVPENPLPEGFDHEGVVATFFPIERCYVHAFADSRCAEINTPLRRFWENWTQNPDNPFRGAMLVGEYYNVSAFASLAIPAVSTMSADIPYYYRSGARLIHFMHVGTVDWGTLALTNTQFATMAWNHTVDADRFLSDFMSTRYGDASQAMSLVYRRLEAAMSNAKPMKHYAGMERHTLRNTIKRATAPVGGKPGDASAEPPGTTAKVRAPSQGDHTTEQSEHAPIEAEPQLFTTKHLRYDSRSAGGDSGPSLAETIDELHAVVRLVEDELLRCANPAVRRRIGADLRRLRYTMHAVDFTYHAVRLRMLESVGDDESACLEARALRDSGEALRREEEMPKLTYLKLHDDWYRLLENGLAATWVAEFYEEAMARYRLEIPAGGASRAEAL